jgi:hypothetical protein
MVTKSLSTLVLVVGCFTAAAAYAERFEWYLFIAESNPKSVLDRVGQELQGLIGTAVPGTIIHVVSTPTHTPVATLEVPTGSPNSRLRHRSLRSGWSALRMVFQGTGGSNQIQLARLSATIGSLRATDWPVRVVLVGSLVYEDPRELGWAMTGGRVPTDQSQELALSPFSQTELPRATEVSWISPTAQWGTDPQHEREVTRFYRLYFQQGGAQPVRVGAEPKAGFRFEPAQWSQPVIARQDGLGVRQVSTKSMPAEAAQRQIVQVPTSIGEPVENAPAQSLEVIADEDPSSDSGATMIETGSPTLWSIKGQCQHVVFIRDLSGSMEMEAGGIPAPWKNEAVLKDLCEKLQLMPFRRFAVVGFYSDDEDVAQLKFFRSWFGSPWWVRATKSNRQRAAEVMAEWKCDGGTPALEAFQAVERLEGVDTVLWYSDGRPPESTKFELLALVRRMAREGVVVNPIGIGSVSGKDVASYDEGGAQFMVE